MEKFILYIALLATTSTPLYASQVGDSDTGSKSDHSRVTVGASTSGMFGKTREHAGQSANNEKDDTSYQVPMTDYNNGGDFGD